jgi:uncharacterized damage-inducible protein DinB
MKKLIFVFALMLCAAPLHAQPEGPFQGFNGEWNHVKSQLIQLAEATPEDKYSWRPAPGVRSIAEVYMHIAIGNYYILSQDGTKVPEFKESTETSITKKAEVIAYLKHSFEVVEAARAQLKPGDLDRKIKVWGKDTTVDAMYLRLILHDYEHMGQAVAYARMNGIVPPWSKPAAK